ncbi:intermembrane transport protein PqiB [Edwardsiella ictaluri]|uniref:Intermembrane transport protein PqiB n=1 Tax=Edwardsiella ictaluri TaxID=67780 RepID=A0ABY8GEF3_EDWIC|nr:intermembrane transport protein PqiB [Edwardsiella ictaluri]AVZ81115.1 intermembrane transport protein PqiB [Edwardsiella ictaluri]EKS7763171.1 intermembrane transport protein PqiB [Edwardsiella ictaluri]EKS7770149.1 intermembrane transport protein PqiB [Edwardsiella ictaluri]EKS7773290.1 intermembrane transport protein PqiB [Edwardsiella ictaluri]EKS7776682.1 intermembrane transport protein PqiB [Edwardsiella ictaluri]
MKVDEQTTAKVERIKRWSPVWIIPILTALIGAWIIFYHFSHQGPEVTLVTQNAEGIIAGKTAIKSRNVDVGMVESVTLSENLNQVIVRARLHTGMEKLLRKDSVFWVVKPQVGREGISGLGTLLSGAYIGLQPGSGDSEQHQFNLLDQPPLAPPDAKGIRIMLVSDKAGQLNPGDPVLFRGLRVGSVETSGFDTKARKITYQLFIAAPYDTLVTENVRFWVDSGISFDVSAQGMRVQMGSLTTLLSGGVSFDVPQGLSPGKEVANLSDYILYDNQNSIQDSLYTEHFDVLMFFADSIRGLQAGAPVEFRGIRLGTVAQVPYYVKGLDQRLDANYRIPVLVHIEPERIKENMGNNFNLHQHLLGVRHSGLRAALKSSNLLTGALYIDLDFYPNAKPWKGPDVISGIPIMPTVSGGLAQLQQKVTAVLDKLNALPLEPMISAATGALKTSQGTMLKTQETLRQLNNILSSKAMQSLPGDLQRSLIELNRTIKGIQPGSPAYNQMVSDLQHLDQVLRELQPVLRTLNQKSNALVFEAPAGKDPHPKGAKP